MASPRAARPGAMALRVAMPEAVTEGWRVMGLLTQGMMRMREVLSAQRVREA